MRRKMKMKRIKLYVAGTIAKCPEFSPPDLDIVNRLISYAYPKHLTYWLDITEGKKGNLILDSGAFSAWTKGKTLDIHTYAQYARDLLDNPKAGTKKIRIVNLDVIPGKGGETKALNRQNISKVERQKNQDTINKSAEMGLMNLRIFKEKYGITPIHVFHQGEDWSWLVEMCKETDYVGISPANDLSVYEKMAWMRNVFSYMKTNNIHVHTHGFGVMIPHLLLELPWTSCDATSWLMIAAMGKIMHILQGGLNANPKETQHLSNPPYKLIAITEQRKPSEKGISKALFTELAASGYSYEHLQKYVTRAAYNVKSLLIYEKWLNYKKFDISFNSNTNFFQYENR